MANKKQTAKIEARKRAAEQEEEAITWATRHTTATTEQTPLFEKFKDFFNIMYAVKSNKNVASWRSKIYIPILGGKAWDFISRLADVEPRFKAGIEDEWVYNEETGKYEFPQEVLDRADRISQKLAHDWKNNYQQTSPRDRVFSTLVDTVVTGTGIAKVGRRVDERVTRAHEAMGDEGGVNLEEEIIQKIIDGANTFEPVNIFNVKVAPKSDDLQSAPWIIIDGFSTLAELKQSGLYDEEALASIDEEYQTDSDPMAEYNHARNPLVQSEDLVQADKSVKFLKTHECYSRNEEGQVVIKTYVEGGDTGAAWKEIKNLVDPYWHNRYPLQSFYIRRKPYSVWGEGLFENNETLQYASNDVFNHYMDNLNIALDGMMMMDENSFVEDFVVAPGEILMFKNEMPKQFKFNEPNPQQLTMVMGEMQKAVEAATVSQYATGAPNSASDKTQGTATGITKIMEAAEDKMGFMRSNFKNSMEGVGQMWIVNDQQFMDRTAVIPNEGPEGIAPTIVTPLDVQGIINITVDDDSLNPVSKSGKREMKKEYFLELQRMADASVAQSQFTGNKDGVLLLDYAKQAQELAFTYGENNFSSYLIQEDPEEEAAAQAEAEAQAAQEAEAQEPAPEPQKPINITISYKDVKSPEAKAALLIEALPNYEGDPADLMQAEREAQMNAIAHDQTIDVAKNVGDVTQMKAPIGGPSGE